MSRRISSHGPIMTSSTPSTRRLLDGVAVSFLTARRSHHGRIVAEKCIRDSLVDCHTGEKKLKRR